MYLFAKFELLKVWLVIMGNI